MTETDARAQGSPHPSRARLRLDPTRPLLIGLLLLALSLRLARVPMRFNQISFAYAAYYEPFIHALARDWTAAFRHFTGLHPPLYSLLFALEYHLWGTPLGMHLLGALTSTLAVLATFALGRRASGAKAGLLAALLLAVGAYPLHYALEVNNYPLLLLFSALAGVGLHGALLRPSRASVGRWSVLAVLHLYTHVLAGFTLALGALFLAVRLLTARRWQPLAGFLPLLLALPLVRPVLELSGRGSTFHNAQLSWAELYHITVLEAAARFGGLPTLLLAVALALWGLWRAGRRDGGAPLLLTLLAGLLPLIGIVVLLKLGIAAAHQFPYYLLCLPSFALAVAMGACGLETHPLAAPTRRARFGQLLWAGSLLALLSAQLLFSVQELHIGYQKFKQFERTPHAVRPALAASAAHGVLWLVAPPSSPDDDKRAVDPVYRLLPGLRSCRFFQPEDLRFEFVDFQYGQPFSCGTRLIHTFTDIYFGTMPRLLQFYLEHRLPVEIVLYDFASAPSYPSRLEMLLQAFPHTRQEVGETLRYAVRQP